MPEEKLLEMSLKKHRVAHGFGEKAQLYNKFAKVQREAAEYMVRMFGDIVGNVESPYLELGAGTGFVTEPLSKLLSEGTMYVTDISEEMLEACSKELKSSEKISFIFEKRDAEDILPANHYGLVVTALTAQWFEDTHATLRGYLEALKPGGILLYSYLDERCFPEWKALCVETGIPYTGNVLPSCAPLHIDRDKFCWEYSSWETFYESYEDPAAFFRNLKRIGAGTQTSGQKNNPGAILALNEQWHLKKRPEFKVSYGITFGAIRKKRK